MRESGDGAIPIHFLFASFLCLCVAPSVCVWMSMCGAPVLIMWGEGEKKKKKKNSPQRMLSRLLHSLRSPSLTTMGACFSSTKSSTINWAGPPRVSTAAGVAAAKADVRAVVDEHHCGPLFLRLAWHDAGTFDAKMVSEGGGS